jgi:hypothetical protein
MVNNAADHKRGQDIYEIISEYYTQTLSLAMHKDNITMAITVTGHH